MDRLKKKVASSSSKVMASLSSSVLSGASSSSSSGSAAAVASTGLPAGHPISSDATAHLTEEERNILHKVFLKEQQFQRETFK